MKKIQKQKIIMALVKHYLSSDMRTAKAHSITSNTKLIQNYQTNTGIVYQQTKRILGNFGNPIIIQPKF